MVKQITDVPDDTNHFHPWKRSARYPVRPAESLSCGVLARPELTCQGLAHNHNRTFRLNVNAVDPASVYQRDIENVTVPF